YIFIEDAVATVRSDLFRHDLARLRRCRDASEILAHLGLREPTELLAVDDQADLDRAGIQLLALGGLLQALKTEDHRVVLGHVILVLFLEEFHDRLAALSDAARFVRHERAARIRLEQMRPEVDAARAEARGPEPTHAAVSAVIRFVVATTLPQPEDHDSPTR